MTNDARFYNCTHCHRQTMICSRCDRGNIYCVDCAQSVRQQALRRAGQKYQSSRKGSLANAKRQRDFRARQRNKITHQGSEPVDNGDLLPAEPSAPNTVKQPPQSVTKNGIRCHFCHRQCSDFLRRDFLRRPPRYRRHSF